ncbi:DNA-binding DDB_G0278111 [Olea europaea subsp. europaea]|uniref:DNA-binding DDB_G0278111 n=2 Tax=Olea europaea subsp. europaea TaxID=158383 RepID=A0A8S0V428_OLEEU|nr:DNA-binding DDB_G0278111 [Olea europaea subsp. europaea]
MEKQCGTNQLEEARLPVRFCELVLDIGFCLLAMVMEDLKALTLRATLLEGVLQIDSADPELEAIRQRRMQELMAQCGMGSQQNSEQQKAQEEAKSEAEEQRQMMLSQILTSEARARVARIALVKPEKARGVEDVILRAARVGQITEKVSEEKLISLLEQINTQTAKETRVTIQRRTSVLDDD